MPHETLREARRTLLKYGTWHVYLCDACDDLPFIDILHDEHLDDDSWEEFWDYERTWEPVPRTLTVRDCQVVREATRRLGPAPAINVNTPDVGRLALAEWRDGFWYEALARRYEVCLESGQVSFEPFQVAARQQAYEVVTDPWALEALHTAGALDGLAGVAIRAAHDPALDWAFNLLATSWHEEAARG